MRVWAELSDNWGLSDNSAYSPKLPYELILKSGNGSIRSEAIPGFQIRIEAMFDAGVNLEELGRLLG